MTVTISRRFPGHRTLDEAAGLVYDHKLEETHQIGAAARTRGREARRARGPSTAAAAAVDRACVTRSRRRAGAREPTTAAAPRRPQ